MKCCIIVNAFRIPRESVLQAERIKYELTLLGANTEIISDGAARLKLSKGEIVTDLTDFDFAVYLDKDKYLSQSLEKAGVRLFNRHNAVRVCDDKAETYIALVGHGFNMPDTMFGALCYNKDCSIEESYVDKVEKTLGYPIIVKESYGSMGKGVYKADDRAAFTLIAEKVKLKPHLFQKFIPTGSGKDVRIIVIGGKAVACMERGNGNDFRSNIAVGGSGKPITPDKEFTETAERAAKILGLDYCGVDLLYGKSGEPILCEVNSNAFFLGMEKVTGINVAKLYAEYMINEIKKEKKS